MQKLFVAGFILLNILVLPIITSPPKAHAAVAEGCGSSFLGLPAWYKYLNVVPDESGGCSVVGPPGNTIENGEIDWEQASGYIAVAVVEMLLRIASLVAVGYVIYGGFRYIASQGEPENAKSARQTIINAIVGLVIAIAAASIVSFVAGRLAP